MRVSPENNLTPEERESLVKLHQLPFRTDRIERLDQARPQRALGRNLSLPTTSIHRLELGMRRRQNTIHQRPQLSQRMSLRYTLLRGPIAEHRRLGHVGDASHQRQEQVVPTGERLAAAPASLDNADQLPADSGFYARRLKSGRLQGIFHRAYCVYRRFSDEP